jgi:hypothetical protein
MKNLSLLALVALLPFPAHAFEFMKCNTMSGKTLWASFGKKMSSGDKAPMYFPVDLTLLQGKALVDRLQFNGSKDAAGIPVEVTSATIAFAFPAKGADGNPQWQAFRLRLYAPGKSSTAYIGEWATGTQEKLENREQAFCSVY